MCRIHLVQLKYELVLHCFHLIVKQMCQKISVSISELTQSADRAAVGLVAQGVCTGIAETQVSAWQDERVSYIRQTHNALRAVVADFVVSNLETKIIKTLRRSRFAKAGSDTDLFW